MESFSNCSVTYLCAVLMAIGRLYHFYVYVHNVQESVASSCALTDRAASVSPGDIDVSRMPRCGGGLCKRSCNSAFVCFTN